MSPVAVIFPLIIAMLPMFRRLVERIVPPEDCKVHA
jgi:hypothetical protein